MSPYTEVILLKRKPGMSREAFLEHYRDVHGPLMVKLMGDKGLVSYEHFPIEETTLGSLETNGSPFDSVSIYTFVSKEAADACHGLEEVFQDSDKCMEMDSLVIFSTERRRVFPLS